MIGRLDHLSGRSDIGVDQLLVDDALAMHPTLGADQTIAARSLCDPGPAVRALVAPAGYGKTTTVWAATDAYLAAGRPVVGLATTNRAAEELAKVGLQAMTIARFRAELHARGVLPGTVFVVDEVSQVATSDAAVVLDAAVLTPGAAVWFLGDPRQGPSVAAGGIAAEIARRGKAGLIISPELTENRRQVEVADRDALAELRAGRAAKSQTIRSRHGWEHEHTTPTETRDAMASAVVADIERHGPDAVAALAVSHADCEDLANRIRDRLIRAGEIAPAGISGPGWGTAERTYAPGDRILLHRSVRVGPMRLHNGSVGTVLVTGTDGLLVRFGGREVPLEHSFATGVRPDGTPNLSHAWARTIDGSQGGTWEVVHLLGTGGLDALRGYVGQSRSRTPTHTWNVRHEPAVDHGGIVADHRDGAEQVLMALKREPDVRFAGVDDPWPVDQRLRAERTEHQRVLTHCPEDRSQKLGRARSERDSARWRVAAAERDVESARQGLKDLGRLPPVRATRRAERERAERRLSSVNNDLDRLRDQLRDAEARVKKLAAHEADRNAFLVREGWRSDRLAAIDRELAQHWAPVILAAVRNDEPLAFGLDRLRQARPTLEGHLRDLRNSLPPDRSEALRHARGDLASARKAVARARLEVTSAHDALDAAGRRHWGRRDRDAIEAAERVLSTAAGRLAAAERWASGAHRAVEDETSAQRAHDRAFRENRFALDDLDHAVRDVEQALKAARAARVIAIADRREPGPHLIGLLGAPPTTAAGREAWCGLAWDVEAWRDDHGPSADADDGHDPLGSRPTDYCDRPGWDALLSRAALAETIVTVAEAIGPKTTVASDDPAAWSARLEHTAAAVHASVAPTREPPGLEIGW